MRKVTNEKLQFNEELQDLNYKNITWKTIRKLREMANVEKHSLQNTTKAHKLLLSCFMFYNLRYTNSLFFQFMLSYANRLPVLEPRWRTEPRVVLIFSS